VGLIRLFLASIVAADHFRDSALRPLGIDMPALFKLGMNAGFAVMFFYMISGFLISTAIATKYERRIADFYANRFIRIFSLYWSILVIIFIFIPPVRSTFVAVSWPDKFTNLFLFGADWRTAFASYPNVHVSALPLWMFQAWTLGAELTFYAFAPWLLRRWKTALAVLVASAATRGVAVALNGGFSVQWTYTFFPATVVFFFLGHFGRVLADKHEFLRSRSFGVGLFVLLSSALMLGSYAEWDSWRFWLATLSFAALLPALFVHTKDNKVLNVLGDLSYPMYLLHPLVMVGLLNVGMPTTPSSWLGVSGSTLALFLTVCFLACALTVSAFVHVLLEKPVASVMHYLVSRLVRVGNRIGFWHRQRAVVAPTRPISKNP
jgi:peptidoglycan/LPS O-acetylase OafA/YrhL